LILHFEKSANVPKAIFQLSGKSSIEIPSLKEILDDLPTIFRYTVSAIAQNSKNFSFNFSDDVFESLKREEWSENWRSFFKFCNAFISGETIIHKGIKSDSEIPKMKDYIKNVTSEGEKVLIKKAIERYKTDKKKICEALGINVKTLNKKIKIYNLK
jgi:DNA-binding NtrC family response regulator